MPIRFRCQDCRSRVKVPEGSQGKQVKCPRCGGIQSVPNRQGKGSHNASRDDLSVHTLVGPMHKAPKRKESLVGGGDSDDRPDGYRRGDGTPSGLNIPPIEELEPSHARDAQQDQAAESQKIADSRRRVQDLFATSHNQETGAGEEAAEPSEPAHTSQALSLNGASSLTDTEPNQTPGTPPKENQTPSPTGWTVDLSAEAYPFLRLVPWVLRLAAVMMIGLAFKAMLLADEQGYSFVVCVLVLFVGFTMVAVTWTVGEIARAVRDIALKRTLA